MDAYASGNWLVKQGKDAEFVRAWRDWLEWTKDNAEGFKWAKLMRFTDDPRRFVSISQWESDKARASWKSHNEFQQRFADVRALTDEFIGGDYNEAVAI
jgi:heme-degrading monooxygenase HmoA